MNSKIIQIIYKRKLQKRVRPCWVVLCEHGNPMENGDGTVSHFDTRKEAEDLKDDDGLYCPVECEVEDKKESRGK